MGTTVVEQNGVDGRSIQIHYYVVSKTGEVLHDITFNSYYIAQNEIIRVGITKQETIGIDTPADLQRAEAFLKR